MFKKSIAGVLITFALAGTAYADCPEATSITKLPDGSFEAKTKYGPVEAYVDPATTTEADARKLKFTASRAKNINDASSSVTCQLEDGKAKPDIAASLTVRPGTTIKLTGANWKPDGQGGDCATKDGDVQKCSFQ